MGVIMMAVGALVEPEIMVGDDGRRVFQTFRNVSVITCMCEIPGRTYMSGCIHRPK